MNVEKTSERAIKLARQLGVQFTPPSLEASAAKAEKRLKQMAEYHSRRDEYDAFVANIFQNYSKDVIQAFIKAAKNPK